MQKQDPKGRRGFFASLGLIAAGGVAAKLASTAPPPVQNAEPADTQPGTGYRLTEHVRKYYKTTSI